MTEKIPNSLLAMKTEHKKAYIEISVGGNMTNLSIAFAHKLIIHLKS